MCQTLENRTKYSQIIKTFRRNDEVIWQLNEQRESKGQKMNFDCVTISESQSLSIEVVKSIEVIDNSHLAMIDVSQFDVTALQFKFSYNCAGSVDYGRNNSTGFNYNVVSTNNNQQSQKQIWKQKSSKLYLLPQKVRWAIRA